MKKSASAEYVSNALRPERLPIIPVTDPRLNMFLDLGVEMYAIAGNRLRYGSFKYLAVLGLLHQATECGMFQKGDVLVEATSGRTGYELIQVARREPYFASDVILVMKDDIPQTKQRAPRLAGARIHIVDPVLGLSPIATAREMGGGGWKATGWQKGEGRKLNLDQYANPAAQMLYRDWAVPKIADAVGEFDVLVAPIGTGGTICGLSEGLRNRFEHITIVGAMCEDGHEIPGMRDLAGMKEIAQPWEVAHDFRVKVERKRAFLCAPWFNWLTGENIGPSSGATYLASCKFIYDRKIEGNLDNFRNKSTGKIKMLFVIHDDIIPYAADRFVEYKAKYFHPSTSPLPEELIFGTLEG